MLMGHAEMDRRQHQRAELRSVVRLLHEGQFMRLRLADISEGGARLCTQRLPVGAEVKLFLPAPPLMTRKEARVWSLAGHVVWTAAGDAGVCFDDCVDNASRSVREYVGRRDA